MCLPRVVGDSLVFYKIDSLDAPLQKSNYGVYEPQNIKSNIIEKDKIDLVIVPGVAFDSLNNRLGFGKGYYDRFLSGLIVNTIAICFKEQIIEAILPVTELDIKMDTVITD